MFINFGGATEDQLGIGASRSASEYVSVDDIPSELEALNSEFTDINNEICGYGSLPQNASAISAIPSSIISKHVPKRCWSSNFTVSVNIPAPGPSQSYKEIRKARSCLFPFIEQNENVHGFIPQLRRISSSAERSIQCFADDIDGEHPSGKISRTNKVSTIVNPSEGKLDLGRHLHRPKSFLKHRCARFMLILIIYSIFLCLSALCFQYLEMPEEQRNLQISLEIVDVLKNCDCVSGKFSHLYGNETNAFFFLHKFI